MKYCTNIESNIYNLHGSGLLFLYVAKEEKQVILPYEVFCWPLYLLQLKGLCNVSSKYVFFFLCTDEAAEM